MEAGMIVTNQDEYRRAFVEYLRKGTPIRLQTKQTETSGQYVWRTRNDDKVRLSHRANDGHVFDWSASPDIPMTSPGNGPLLFRQKCSPIPRSASSQHHEA